MIVCVPVSVMYLLCVMICEPMSSESCVYQWRGSGLFVLVSACACEQCDANKRLASGTAAAVASVTAARSPACF